MKDRNDEVGAGGSLISFAQLGPWGGSGGQPFYNGRGDIVEIITVAYNVNWVKVQVNYVHSGARVQGLHPRGETAKKVAEAEAEKNRAVVATLNAEVRRAKAAMRKELPKLNKLAPKKVKGVKAEDILTRPGMALALAGRIDEVPDGVSVSRKKNAAAKGSPLEIKIDNYSPEDIMRSGVKEHSEESKGFQDELELRKEKQDERIAGDRGGLNP